MLNEFKKFILRGNVVDLAVGIAIGAAFTALVNALVKDLINPVVSIFYQGHELSKAHFTVRGAEFLYGDLINAFITFFLVAVAVFFLVVQPINKLNEFAFKTKDTGEPTSRKCPYCLGKIPKAASKCMHCGSKVSKTA